ncbi:hypothetical protein EBF04_01010 [Streptomyces sp. I6]|nr:hypothetical protein EBF04_01010 [Streptomyces sp. I6]
MAGWLRCPARQPRGCGPLTDRRQAAAADLVQDEGAGAGSGVPGQHGHGEGDEFRDGRQQPRQRRRLGCEPRRRGLVASWRRGAVAPWRRGAVAPWRRGAVSDLLSTART